jgi:hypothetical protein
MVGQMLAAGWDWQATILQIRTMELAVDQRIQPLLHGAQELLQEMVTYELAERGVFAQDGVDEDEQSRHSDAARDPRGENRPP